MATVPVPEVIGVRHPTVKRLRRLSRRRSSRTDEGAFVVDGPGLLAEALDAGVAIDEVVAEPGAPADLLARATAAGAVVRHAASGTLAGATDTTTPQPTAAVARLPGASVAEVVGRTGPLALVLAGVADPGNAGTLLRSAEAAGAGAVLFCDGSVDPYGPKCVRSSAGSLFRLAVVRAASSDEVLGALRAVGIPTVATVARGPAPAYDQVDLAGPVALVLGSEAHGLADAVRRAVDTAVTIPMAGPTESLNVAMAGTVLCFEALRQRRRPGEPTGRRPHPDARVAGITTPTRTTT
ncbi:MAG TPA: RNA methyltransferase [Acidimicrobiales bacterium]|nr:RNA methyltransferase [Acidimicrobiales bacterium]